MPKHADRDIDVAYLSVCTSIRLFVALLLKNVNVNTKSDRNKQQKTHSKKTGAKREDRQSLI